jgi:hypothetical protein
MKKSDLKKIKRAILRNRAGLKDTPEHQLMRIWDCLNPETREAYLNSSEPEQIEEGE